MRKTLNQHYLLLLHPILLSISHPIDLKLLKKHFQMEPSWSWSWSQNRSSSKIHDPGKYVTCCWLTAEHNCVLCELRAFHWRWYNVDITGEVTGVCQSAYPGPLPPPCVTNNGQVKHSPPPPPWGHLAPSTVSTPGVSSWNIEIVGILSSPVQTYLFLFLSLSYVISKVP